MTVTTTSTPVSRPTLTMPSSTTPTTTTAIASSWSSASRLDQALLIAGVVTFTSAAAYAGYTYWQRTSSRTTKRTSNAATTKPKGCGCGSAKPQSSQSQPSSSTTQPTQYAAATAIQQLTKPPQPSTSSTTTSTTTTTPTPASLPPPLRNRLQSAQAILFDLDGTLVESAEIWYQLITGASQHFGYSPVSYEAWQATFGQSMEKNVEMWMVGLDQSKFNTYCDDHYSDHLNHLKILDGSIDLLTLVNQKYVKERVAIVTNCPRKITEIILNHLNLNQYFSHIICAGDSLPIAAVSPFLAISGASGGGRYGLKPKPATDILVQGAHQVGVDVSKCCFVGDSRYDMMSGQAAGCAVTVGVGITTGDVFVKDTREAVSLFELA